MQWNDGFHLFHGLSHVFSGVLAPYRSLSDKKCHWKMLRSVRLKMPVPLFCDLFYKEIVRSVSMSVFMGDFPKNSAYFQKSKLYFLKSKPYFFENVMIWENLYLNDYLSHKPDFRLWTIPWRSGEGYPSRWTPHGYRAVKGWRVRWRNPLEMRFLVLEHLSNRQMMASGGRCGSWKCRLEWSFVVLYEKLVSGTHFFL